MIEFKTVSKSSPSRFWVCQNSLFIGIAGVEDGIVAVLIDIGGLNYTDDLYTKSFREELVDYCQKTFEPNSVAISYENVTEVVDELSGILKDIEEQIIMGDISLS